MKKTPGRTPEARAKYWTKIIEEARRYPAGVTAYLRFMNLDKNTYYHYFKKLRAQHPEWHDLTNRPEIPGGARESSTEDSTNEVLDTQVVLNSRRRKWTIKDKTRILEETDNASPKELASILRREGLYVHTLNKWRTARDMMDMAQTKNAKSSKSSSDAATNKKLREENAKLQKKLRQATEIITLQKKISDMMSDLNLRDE